MNGTSFSYEKKKSKTKVYKLPGAGVGISVEPRINGRKVALLPSTRYLQMKKYGLKFNKKVVVRLSQDLARGGWLQKFKKFKWYDFEARI